MAQFLQSQLPVLEAVDLRLQEAATTPWFRTAFISLLSFVRQTLAPAHWDIKCGRVG